MSLEALLAELKREYVAGLPSRVETMREHGNSDPGVLRDDFHKLKGTGKTYGVPDLSVLGELGERICLERPDNIAKGLPLILELISTIHTRTSREESFDLASDPRFSEIKKAAINS